MSVVRDAWHGFMNLFSGLPFGDSVLPMLSLVAFIWGVIMIARKWFGASDNL